MDFNYSYLFSNVIYINATDTMYIYKQAGMRNKRGYDSSYLAKNLKEKMKFVVISDTHTRHDLLELPVGDVLLHAGDLTNIGFRTDVIHFLEWFESQPFRYKIFIAGNHDFFFEKHSREEINSLIPPGIIYLNDSGVTIEHIPIWGSPITPWFYHWAFNRHRGEAIQKHWNLIPPNTRILMTHGPAYQILDRTKGGDHTGCKDLLQVVQKINPEVHVFGHIHEAYGQTSIGGTTFINASVLDERYRLKNSPLTFEL